MKKVIFTAACVLLGSTSAFAQDASTTSDAVEQTDAVAPAQEQAAPADVDPAQPADSVAPADDTSTAVAPAEPAAPASDFTQAEIDGFGQAYVKVQEVAADTTLDAQAKQTQMAAIVGQSGIDAQTFNDIGQAIQSDADLKQKVQMAIASAQGGTVNQ